MMKFTGFTPHPHCMDEYLEDGIISYQEYALLGALLRKTWGWHKEREWIKNKELAKSCNMSITLCKKVAASLNEKDLIDIFYLCPDCDSIVTYNPIEYQCDNCQSKNTPCKVYEPKLREITSEEIASLDTPPISQNTPPLSNYDRPPYQTTIDPLSNYDRVTALKPLPDNVPQTPKETLLNKALKEISQSENVTNEDPEANWENFDILEERENFSEKAEPEEEKREERDFRSIKEPEPNQTENEGMVKFTAGLLAGIGNPSAFAEEKPREREEKTTEKEVKDLLNSHMANNWRTQISESDNEHIKEIMKYDYKHIEASCEDRLTKNRPAIPKLFPKWVLDGLRSGIKAKKLTQLEKEAFLENELEKSYDNGNGDKILCRDVIKKLYSVIQIVGIMNYRYRAEMDWCEMPWQCLED